MNLDIFAYINFRGFMKIDNFARIKICALSITGSIGYYKINFHSSRIFNKRESCENIYIAKM